MKSLKLVLGVYDDPERQTQKNYSVDILHSNIAVFGTAMSGKTTLLKTLLLRMHQVLRVTDKEEIYILDFSNDLDSYKELPYVVAYFDAFQEENVRRIFKVLEERYQQNIRALPGMSFIDADLNKKNCDLRHITFILDGLNAFMSDDKYTVYHETFRKLARDGLSKGVSVIFTANDLSNGINRILSFFHSVIAFDIPKDQYYELFNKKVEKPIIVKGRAIANLDTEIYEFQGYFPFNKNEKESNDKNVVKDLAERLAKEQKDLGDEQQEKNSDTLQKCYDRKMKQFVGDLVKEDWQNYTGTGWYEYHDSFKSKSVNFIAGLDYYSFEPIKIDLEKIRSIAIYGKKASGKTNLLSLILEAAMNIPGVFFVFWEDGRQGLTRNAEVLNKTFWEKMEEHKQYEIFNKWKDIEEFIRRYGYDKLESPEYFSDREDGNFSPESENGYDGKPKEFTVFVIQSKLFYQQIPGLEDVQYISRLSQFISNENAEARKLFIFSDAQRIVDRQMATIFNNYIDHAFLLYDILRFINDRGKESVFGTLDQAELKENYGKCETGDGFYYNLELDEYTKLKFIKQQ